MRLPWKQKPQQPRTVTHWAGEQFTFRNVSVQRCLWCGAEIERKDWSKIELPAVEGKTFEQVQQEAFLGTWGGWVSIDINGMRYQTPFDPFNHPDDACIWEGVSDKDKAQAIRELAAQRQEFERAQAEPDPVQPEVHQADDLTLETTASPPWKREWTDEILERYDAERIDPSELEGDGSALRPGQ